MFYAEISCSMYYPMEPRRTQIDCNLEDTNFDPSPKLVCGYSMDKTHSPLQEKQGQLSIEMVGSYWHGIISACRAGCSNPPGIPLAEAKACKG